MPTIAQLTFSPTPGMLAFGLLVAAATIALGWLNVRRSPHPRRTTALEILRTLCVVFVVALLCKPEWQKTVHPDTRPRIAILADRSGSTQTVDAIIPSLLNPAQPVVSRQQWIDDILAAPLWAPLFENGRNERLDLEISRPDAQQGPVNLQGTDLTTPIEDLLDREGSLRAIVLLSDGDWNLGQPPVVAAQKLLRRGIPLFTLPVGSQQRLPDLDLLSVTAPAYGIVGENVQIPFSIRSSLDREVRTSIRLRDDKGREKSKEIVLPPGVETYDSILWRIETEGTSTLELILPKAEGELIESNNQRKFTLSGRPESIRVLVIETLPRWEYRFLRNALSRDPGVELSCLLFHPQLGVGGGKDYIDAFPEKPEDLSKYDVIFLGDVGVAPDQLTREQCTLIRGMVESQASGVVFMPGPQGNQFSLLDTDLADLLPVQLDSDNRPGLSENIAAPLNLTSEGRSSLLTMLADTEESNPDVWRSLPGFFWHAPVIRAKGGTEVLAVHANRRGRYGPVPLVVTKAAGNGKVLFMGIDSAWRWRRGVEDKYHYRFWGQVARWMSYQRNMAAGQRVRLYFTPERPTPGDTVTLHANAFNPNGAPLQDGNVIIEATAPDGRRERLVMEKSDASWGAFQSRLKVDLPGEWSLKASVEGEENEGVETRLLAQATDLEKTGQPARPDVLEEMARIARGRMITPEQLPDLVREIQSLPEPRPLVHRIPLWSHVATFATLVALLSLFWIGRKWNGAI